MPPHAPKTATACGTSLEMAGTYRLHLPDPRPLRPRCKSASAACGAATSASAGGTAGVLAAIGDKAHKTARTLPLPSALRAILSTPGVRHVLVPHVPYRYVGCAATRRPRTCPCGATAHAARAPRTAHLLPVCGPGHPPQFLGVLDEEQSS